jgi:hypothetical protein
MPIAAGIIGDGLMAALWTGVEMSAQRGSTTALNGSIGFELLKIEAPLIPVQEVAALRAENVGHLHGGADHFGFVRW